MIEPPAMVGESASLEAALARLSAAAKLDRPILIVGERGCGKELAAARVHLLSKRWDGPYVAVNCAALSDALLESELFGHEPGAFTGAMKRHIGRFERADGGTLFLDEIASASLRVQEKILRVVEYGTFERLGGAEEMTVDVRLVAAANVDLPARARDGRFRADLLDRLAFDVVTLPPLRARKEDIMLLAEHFGRRMHAEICEPGTPFPGFSNEAAAAFEAHQWPGNVRELKNVAERAVYRWMSDADVRDDPIDAAPIDPFASPWRPLADLEGDGKDERGGGAEASNTVVAGPASPSRHAAAAPAGAYDFKAWVADLEKSALQEALASCRHNQTETAERLGLTYHQLRGMMKKYGLLGAKADA